MGLYLTVFDNDYELDGVEVGSYADFAAFRSAVIFYIEDGVAGSRCPTLILHSDCDGQWSPEEAVQLRMELELITREFIILPPESDCTGWKLEVAKLFGLSRSNLYECFFDVDGEPLLDRLLGLVRLSIDRNLPILFQ
ncbi:MAG: hypothetical protein RL145_1615 [Pseudomonadota bacterium]|jgi:hypothetical protein